MRLKQMVLSTATSVLVLTGCSNDHGGPILPEIGTEAPIYENGIIVVNEGGITNGNASVSFISDDLSVVQNNIFSTSNGVNAWGDTAQSMTFDGDLGYIVVSYSQKVEVVNRYTFKSITTIGGPGKPEFLNPRYMAIANGKGYVTNWGDPENLEDDFVAVINLESNALETKIPVGEGPERILVKDNSIYVALEGGYNFNTSVVRIDATSDTVTDIIEVAHAPNSLQSDDEGNLWILSGGKPAYTEDETAGQLHTIDMANTTVTASYAFESTEHPGYLSYEDGSLYYTVAGRIFKMDVSSTALPTEAAITGTSFYDMTVKDGRLYGADAKDFASNGTLEIYDLSDDSLVTTKEVGINPGSIYFNGAAEK